MRWAMLSVAIKILRPCLTALEYDALPGRMGLKLFRWFSEQHTFGRRLLDLFICSEFTDGFGWWSICEGWLPHVSGGSGDISSWTASDAKVFEVVTGGWDCVTAVDAATVFFGLMKLLVRVGEDELGSGRWLLLQVGVADCRCCDVVMCCDSIFAMREIHAVSPLLQTLALSIHQ